LEYSGQIVKLEITNKSLSTDVSIKKTGPKEATSGQPVRYVFSRIGNNSNVMLQSFYWRDTLPAAVRLDKVVTGTYNFPGTYKIVYKVNNTGDYRTLADSLSTSRNYTLAASPTALGLAANERVTEIMFVFGQVPGGFSQVEAPMLHCKAVSGLTAGSSFVNVTDVGGTHDGVVGRSLCLPDGVAAQGECLGGREAVASGHNGIHLVPVALIVNLKGGSLQQCSGGQAVGGVVVRGLLDNLDLSPDGGIGPGNGSTATISGLIFSDHARDTAGSKSS
jgi:hypothetical protein